MKYKIEASRLLFFRTGAELLRFALLVFLKLLLFCSLYLGLWKQTYIFIHN